MSATKLRWKVDGTISKYRGRVGTKMSERLKEDVWGRRRLSTMESRSCTTDSNAPSANSGAFPKITIICD